MGKARVPPHLRLLPSGFARLSLVPSWPSMRCGICGEPFNRHDESLRYACQRCGSEFAWACYWAGAASVREAVTFEVATTEAELEAHFFLCRGCRS